MYKDCETLAERLTGESRQTAARLVHEWLRNVRGEADATEIGAALNLRDIYDCHACVDHVAQVYVKGIMGARAAVFGMREILSPAEAAEIARRASDPGLRLYVPGTAKPAPDCQCAEHLSRKDAEAMHFDLVVDVRTSGEYAEHHAKGAVNCPLEEYLADPGRVAENRDSAILFVCSRGVKSRLAAEAAVQAGFRNVWYAGEAEDFLSE